MDKPRPIGILATDYARQVGLTNERVYQLINEGKLESYRVKHGTRQRVYVVPPEQVIDGDAPAPTGLPIAVEPSPQLTALSDYNTRLVEPWVKRVSDLEGTVRKQAEEIGDLRRQVRQLHTALRGMEAALRRIVNTEDS